MADAAVESRLVEPVDPVQGAELEVIDPSPGSFVADTLSLVEADRALGQSIVVEVPTVPMEATAPASRSRLA